MATKNAATPTTTGAATSTAPAREARARLRICHRLRSKAMYMDVEYDPTVPGGVPGDGYFWCTHTMNCLGPDGRVATRETCAETSGRACYEKVW